MNRDKGYYLILLFKLFTVALSIIKAIEHR